jgi:hypothetical protein
MNIMRHTLLPLQERQSLRKEYRIRAVIVLLFMLSISGFIGIIALFPSFIRAYSEEDAAISKIVSLETGKNSAENKALEDSVALSEKLLASLENGMSGFKASAVINGIIGMRGPLRLTSIAITRTSTTTVSAIVQGIAPTRNSLLSFKTRFEAAAPGNKADLPVSQLGKSSDLQFSLQLTEQLP